jgi:hypothetical protein
MKEYTVLSFLYSELLVDFNQCSRGEVRCVQEEADVRFGTALSLEFCIINISWIGGVVFRKIAGFE